MLRASPPPRFSIPFAASAGGSFIRAIPQASQIGIISGAASLTDGFPPLNFQPVASGGIPPFGQDMNGILNQLSLWAQWHEGGGPVFYDATFAAAAGSGGSGGYPQNAILMSAVVPGNFWMSTADNNTTDPDSISAANWVPAPGSMPSGTPFPSLFATVPNGFVPATGATIGNAASNGTARANGDTLLLYRKLWTLSASVCPIFTSAGSASTRGANPDADFAANKAIATVNMLGTGLMGIDQSSSRLSGVPVSIGSTTAPASLIGENLNTLTAAQLALHTHNGSGTTGNMNANNPHSHTIGSVNLATATGGNPGFTGSASIGMTQRSPVTDATDINHGHAYSFTTDTGGSGGQPHNNVALSTTVYWMLKL